MCSFVSVFFFNDTATTEIYTLSYTTLFRSAGMDMGIVNAGQLQIYQEIPAELLERVEDVLFCRSEEHTSELQSRRNLVCRLLLEKKKK